MENVKYTYQFILIILSIRDFFSGLKATVKSITTFDVFGKVF